MTAARPRVPFPRHPSHSRTRPIPAKAGIYAAAKRREIAAFLQFPPSA
ncbi:MAG: hypothetical protein ACR2QC_01740 [Gammaproteobacteria bacterium]